MTGLRRFGSDAFGCIRSGGRVVTAPAEGRAAHPGSLTAYHKARLLLEKERFAIRLSRPKSRYHGE